jgi:DNA topoisomerase-1
MAIKNLTVGTPTTLKKLTKVEHKTMPPARFSEVSLIKKLSDLEIGRPSTFASIVSVIQERGYVVKVKGQQLAPTFLGFAVTRLLMDKFPLYTAYDYTSQMEIALDEVGEGKKTRVQFLSQFWNGNNGFEAFVKNLRSNIDWDEIRKIATLDLHNGYSVVFNKFGAFLQDNNGTPDEKGYLPSVKLSEDALAEDFLDPEECKKLLSTGSKRGSERELGILTEGEYKGWTVTVREGKFGEFCQAVKPGGGSTKPVNHKLPEGKTLETVTFDDVKGLFAEIKLPRWSPDSKWLVGLNSKTGKPYMGYKTTPKAKRLNFKPLPDGTDPRTITFDEVKALWG